MPDGVSMADAGCTQRGRARRDLLVLAEVEIRMDTQKTIGPYRLHDTIGAGGFATVWRAEHEDGHFAALKLLHERYVDRPSDEGPTVAERFLEEGRLLARLEHPCLPKVLSVIDDWNAGDLAYAMEWVDGADLAERAAQLSLPQVLDVFATVSEVLAFLHRRGIVHRDIKPTKSAAAAAAADRAIPRSGRRTRSRAGVEAMPEQGPRTQIPLDARARGSPPSLGRPGPRLRPKHVTRPRPRLRTRRRSSPEQPGRRIRWRPRGESPEGLGGRRPRGRREPARDVPTDPRNVVERVRARAPRRSRADRSARRLGSRPGTTTSRNCDCD